jgi:stress response protein YsnF
VERVSWTDSKVYVGLSREAIKNGPEYADSTPVTREYENRIYLHYGRPPYWLHEAERNPSSSQSGV